MRSRFSSILPATVLFTSALTTQMWAADAKLKPYQEMDYGRFFSATFDNAQGKNVFTGSGSTANKGIVVKVGSGENESALLFDTDLLRMAGGWTGGFFKQKGVAFDGAHGPNPGPAEKANVVFETNPTGPGWSKGADLNDPRKVPTGPGAAKIPFGPVPREWAKYRGLFRSGEHTVFAYTVGSAPILEMPGAEKSGDQTFLTRTINVTGAGEGSTMVVADFPEGSTVAVENGVVVAQGKDARYVISAVGLPIGAQWLTVAPGRVTLKLPAFAGSEAFKIAYWKGEEAAVGAAKQAARNLSKPESLVKYTKGGAAQWKEEVTVPAVTSKKNDGAPQQPFVVETLGIPSDNPYKSWIRVGAFDFFSNGEIAFSTWSGDVWVSKGVGTNADKITWHRYATGLFQPLGLKIVKDQVYTLGRDQITRFHDLDKDGEADFYENFNNDVQVTPGFHEFAFELQTDPEGNFYFAKGGPVNPGGRGWGPLSEHNGCLFKVSKDGQKFEVFATGLRAPNGIGVSPKGEVTNGDNQGTWVPADYIHFVSKGEMVEVPDLSHLTSPPDRYATHLCWIPYDMDNSCGSQVWVTSDKWGPLKDRMLYLSYGKSSIFSVLEEKVGDVRQGGVVKLPLQFETGLMRARFSPTDGQLYVSGLKGWQTNGAKDGAIQRVRYTGAPMTIQNSLRVTDKGIHIGFNAPVDPETAGSADNYTIQQYNYRWTKEYGSADYKVSDPEQKGRDTVEIKSVKVSPDRKNVFLEVPGLKPVMQMRIKMNLKSADGSPVPNELANTINVVPPEK